MATNLPNAADSDELLYYTNWCAFDGENLLTEKIVVLNTIDGYYIEVPENLEGHLAVLKDTDEHRRVLYYFDPESGTISDRIATISVVSEKKWSSKDYDKEDLFELGREGDLVFAGSVNLAGKVQISEKRLKELFKLVGQEAQK